MRLCLDPLSPLGDRAAAILTAFLFGSMLFLPGAGATERATLLSALSSPEERAFAAATSDTTAPAPLPLYVLPPVTVTASRFQRVPLQPGARTVLDRRWLARRDPAHLADALLPVAGLRITDAGDGVSRTVSLRGLGADRVAVLVDGVPLNTAQGGGVDLEPLDPENLERVEITRGAMGALYGPYALGGAVNLVRRVGAVPTTARLAAGTQGRRLLRLRHGWRAGRWTASGSFRTEAFSPRLGSRISPSEGTGFTTTFAFHPSWATAMEARVEGRSDRRHTPGSRFFPTPKAKRTDRFGGAELAARAVTIPGVPGVMNLHLGASSFLRSYRDPANPWGPVDDRHENRRWRADASWKRPVGSGTMVLRAETVRDRLHSTTDGDVSRDRAAAALYVEQPGTRWGADLAVRADAVQGWSPRVTARLTVTRILAGSADRGSWLAARLGGGTAFRTPTFDDLFWPARATAAGNPHLSPEHARDLDLGLEWVGPDRRVQASAFRNEVRDLIQWSPGVDGVWRPHNVGRARLQGLELEAAASLPLGRLPLRVDAAYSFLDARDATGDPVTGGLRLVGRAEHAAFVEIGAHWRRWEVAVGSRVLGRVPLTAANTKWAEGYTLWHARVRFRLAASARLELEGRNLLDVRYEDIRGYATLGRELVLGIRVAPKGDLR